MTMPDVSTVARWMLLLMIVFFGWAACSLIPDESRGDKLSVPDLPLYGKLLDEKRKGLWDVYRNSKSVREQRKAISELWEMRREKHGAIEKRREAADRVLIRKHAGHLQQQPGDPVLGAADHSSTLVVFVDHACPYSRAAAPDVVELADSGARVVIKEWPVLGVDSAVAARASVAAARQPDWRDFYLALTSSVDMSVDEAVVAAAGEAGMDVELLAQDAESPSSVAVIERNRDLAESLRLTGTPSFVVTHANEVGELTGGRIFRGESSQEELRLALNSQRGSVSGETRF